MSDVLTQERLKERLHYNPETGVFTRVKTVRNAVKVGDVAGTIDHYGYRKIQIGGKIYSAHRLAWLYVHGVWPANQIDHINGTRDDNCFANLREATIGENQHNRRNARSDNKSGFLGVSPDYGKYRAQIGHHGKKIYLGAFLTPELAHSAYVEAKRKIHQFSTI